VICEVALFGRARIIRRWVTAKGTRHPRAANSPASPAGPRERHDVTSGPPPTCCATSGYEGGRLVCETDYVRGRMMKTNVTVFPDGRFTLTMTIGARPRAGGWAQLQGKKVAAPRARADESESGD